MSYNIAERFEALEKRVEVLEKHVTAMTIEQLIAKAVEQCSGGLYEFFSRLLNMVENQDDAFSTRLPLRLLSHISDDLENIVAICDQRTRSLSEREIAAFIDEACLNGSNTVKAQE